MNGTNFALTPLVMAESLQDGRRRMAPTYRFRIRPIPRHGRGGVFESQSFEVYVSLPRIGNDGQLQMPLRKYR
jgi:hypothetical protein